MTRLGLAATVLVGWFTWASPKLATSMRSQRGGHTRNISTSQMLDTMQGNTSLLNGEERTSFMTAVEEVVALQEEEEALVTLIWSLLPEEARMEALEISSGPPMPSKGRNNRMFEPETASLLDALIQTHGYTRGAPSDIPSNEGSGRMPRNVRLGAARQVVLNGHLNSEQAAAAIDAVMRLSAIQDQRVLQERRLMMQIPPAVHRAITSE